MKIKNYPRVLVISSSAFNDYTGTGVTLSNLFRGWPKGKLAMIYSDSLFEPNIKICNNNYKHEHHERKILFISSILSVFRKNKKKIVLKKTHSTNEKRKSYLNINNRVLKIAGKVFGNLEPLGRIVINDNIKKWILDFKPDIIYSPFSSITYMKFISEVKALTKAEIAVHFMDDWPTIVYRKGVLSPIFRLQMKIELKKMLAIAKVRICIGTIMSKEYENRYGYQFNSFSNPEDSDLWAGMSKKSVKTKGTFKVIYIGTFNSKNIQTIEKISSAVDMLYKSGNNINMEIYSFQPRADNYRTVFEKKGCVTVKEVPEGLKEFRKLLCSGDLLVIPLDYTNESIERMRLSFFTKIPAYMLSGVPILLCGPTEIGVVQEAKTEGWAYVVSNNSKIAIVDAIRKLMKNINLRSALVIKSNEIANRRHDAKNVREQFRLTLLSGIVNSNKN